MSEIKQLTPEMIAALKKPLPPEAIKPHPTKPYLSSIKVIYAVERLNDVFGLGGWHDRYEFVEKIAQTNKKGEGYAMVVVKGFLSIPEYGIEKEAYGGNDNEDLGDAYKGACTDALSKICGQIYIGMDVYKGQSNGNGAHPARPVAEVVKAARQPDMQEEDPFLTEQPAAPAHVRPQPTQAPFTKPAAAPNGKPVISEAQSKRFFAISRTGTRSEQEIRNELGRFGWTHSKEITRDKYEELCAWVAK